MISTSRSLSGNLGASGVCRNGISLQVMMSQSGKPKFDYHISRVHLRRMGLNFTLCARGCSPPPLPFPRGDISPRNLNRNGLEIYGTATNVSLPVPDEDREEREALNL